MIAVFIVLIVTLGIGLTWVALAKIKNTCKHKWKTISILDLKREQRTVGQKYIQQCEHCGELDEFDTEPTYL